MRTPVGNDTRRRRTKSKFGTKRGVISKTICRSRGGGGRRMMNRNFFLAFSLPSHPGSSVFFPGTRPIRCFYLFFLSSFFSGAGAYDKSDEIPFSPFRAAHRYLYLWSGGGGGGVYRRRRRRVDRAERNNSGDDNNVTGAPTRSRVWVFSEIDVSPGSTLRVLTNSTTIFFRGW